METNNIMRITVSLQNEKTKELLLERVRMHVKGEESNLLELLPALEMVKAECNKVANEHRVGLKDCSIAVSIG
jgi:hypothetical protein